jgi:hypothetical protein
MDTDSLNKEERFKIPSHDNYEITKSGNVYSKTTKKWLKKRFTRGYHNVALYENGKITYYSVHRLVAIVFLPNPNNLPLVNHKDGNKFNNNVDNLEWISHSDNCKHARDTGITSARSLKSVQEVDKDGNIIKTYTSIKEAAENTGCSPTNIGQVCKGKLQTTGGRRWKYVEEEEVPDKDKIMKRWKQIEEFPNYYVSKRGKVFSVKFNIFIKPYISLSGYEMILIKQGNVKRHESVHRLVAKLYLDNPDDYGLVNHKDGNKTNNYYRNLEWCNHKQNLEHAMDSGLNKLRKAVIKLDKDGNEICKYKSIKDAAKAENEHAVYISNCCRGLRDEVSGYKYKFE